ncbi:MAG: ATP-binding cassette domain-containing protein [Desulfobacteraceae bacterium]|nr:MAG: ATP-binding cassette domain-containing protein [Desulfobacteraceae bacterium]
MIECKNINYRYPGAQNPVFNNLSCRVGDPGFHALFGQSGVGKSTFARMIAGQLNGFAGEIAGKEPKKIYYSYNLERLPGWSGVGEHIEKVTPEANKSGISEIIESFGLSSCMDSGFSRLSLGQRNRVNLARYLLQDFDLLIMDESLANVDEATREQIIFKIKAMFPEKSFLYISHSVAEVSRFCRNILVLRDFSKSPQTLTIEGRDNVRGTDVVKKDLEQTMLEIVNAS